MAMRIGFGMVISGVMIALGIFVGARLLANPDQPLTGTRMLDGAFALFFIARGALYFWSARQRERARSFRDRE